MMHADKVTQKGEGKVVAIIDFGRGNGATRVLGSPARNSCDRQFQGCISGTAGRQSSTYVSEVPLLTTTRTVTTMPLVRVAGITAANGDQIAGYRPRWQIIVAKVARQPR